MTIVDEIKLAMGLPRTTDEEMQFVQTSCVAANAANAQVASESERRVAEQQTELDLKSTAEAFTFAAPAKPAIELSLQNISRLKRAISIALRDRKQQVRAAKASCRITLRSAKPAYSNALRSAKINYARAVSNLLQVEHDTRRSLDKAYDDLVAGALVTLKETQRKALETQEQSINKINEETTLTVQALELNLRALQDEMVAAPIDRIFGRIDMSFLRKPKGNGSDAGLPLFAVFTDKQPEFHLSLKAHKHAGSYYFEFEEVMECSSPSTESHFDRFRQTLISHVEHTYRNRVYPGMDLELTVKIEAGFAGTIPESVRETIRRSRLMFDEILIVSEAPTWSLTFSDGRRVNGIEVGDPLVIGRKGGLFWLIDVFDTTPAEDYVRREFSSDRVN